MPPKQKITREMLLIHAYQIAKEQGIAAVTSRSVANAVGCSIQPVFSQFPTMEELRQATFDYVCQVSVAEVLAFKEEPVFFARTTKWVIDLARKRPNLFQLIYLSNGFRQNTLLDAMMNYENNQEMITKMTEVYGLDAEACKDILMRSLLMLVGAGAMICFNHMEFQDEQIMRMMKQTVADMVQGAKGGKV